MTEPQRQDELPLAQRILQSGIPRLLAPERAASFVAEFLNKAVCSGSAADDAAFLRETDAGAFVAAVAEGSRFLKMAFNRDPANVVRILRMSPERHLEELVGGLLAAAREDIPAKAWMQRLRTFKHEAALVIALCDLGGAWSIMKVTQALTQAADAAVAASIEHLFEQAVRRGDWLAEAGCTSSAASSGYFILAMGKHGAGELNFSSDIDLIVFYEPSKARLRAGLSPSEFFIRMTRDLVRFMNERTADGYVFRTDLRLRPDPGATHVAMSIASALHYYESFGQNWERAAMIKARPIAGDMAQGRAFLAELAPFIWRKYLDFAAIADIHAMKRQIHAHRGFAKIAVEGHNIKLGRGGIREIEFFAQTQQLIAGGRQPDLRVQRTLDALAALAERGWIEPEVQMALDEAYCFLRRIEHRIQMVGDEQTHLVPREPEALASLARFSGYSTSAEFSDALRCRLETVQRHYAALFEHGPELGTATANLVLAGEEDDPDTVAALAAMGFTQPSQVLTTVRAWHRGRYPAIRSGGARERLTEVQPLLIEALSRTVNPDAALAGFDRFLSTLPAGIQLFALLKANPELLRLMADIMGSAPRLAAILSRRRRVFDAVLDPRILGSLPTAEEVDEMIRGELSAAATIEEVMDRARVIGREQMFLIGVRLLTGAIGADQAGPAYAIVAEQLIRHLHAAIEDDFTAQHGRVPRRSSLWASWADAR